jgi:hypothetical protein
MATKTAKTETAPTVSAACLADLTRFGAPMTRMIAGPTEAWLQWQADALKAVEPVMKGWLERRREATTATLETMGRLAHCGDLGAAALIQGEWFDGALKRLNADIQTLTEHAMTLSQEAVSVSRRAAHSAADMQIGARPQAVEKAAEIEAAA